MRRPDPALIGLCFTVASLLVLAGCGAAPSAPAATVDSHGKAFTGPYANDFAYSFERTRSPHVKAILADGTVTSSEFAESRANVTACLDDSGLKVDYDDVHGGLGVETKNRKYPKGTSERINARLQACERDFDGGVQFLYEQATRNPENVDTRPAVVACLRDSGLVPEGYTIRDYDSDYADDDYPFPRFDETGMTCMDDPLGLWAKRE